MINLPKKILEKEFISNAEMKEIISDVGEIGSLQRRTLEYVSKFSKLSPKKAKELREKLLSLEDITEEEAVMIVNILPRTAEELRDIFHHRKTILPKEFIDKILQLINEYIEGRII